MGSHNRYKGRICVEERKNVSVVKGRKRGVCEFIQEQLRKEYIRPSKLLQTAPVFFIEKKDGKKKMVQDYRHLNEWTIKNNYSLPLILNIVENIGIKKVFTKIDLRWNYNNDLINTGKVVVFIDNVIIGTESKEEHDELVVEVIKRLKENDLYVKPEKCK